VLFSRRKRPSFVLNQHPSFAVPFCLRRTFLLASLLVTITLAGCSRMRHADTETVYVSARKTYLRDRVAAVSNRTAQVENGEALVVLEHGRRFMRVRTSKNEEGWIEQHMVIDAKTHDAFDQLAAAHKNDPPAATATLRDDLYMHVSPGRDTDRFYLLAGESKVQLLQRGTVTKTPVAGATPLAALAQPKQDASGPKGKTQAAPPEAAKPVPPPVFEDWWLARDSQGHTGWLLGNRVDVDVPDAIGEYGEGQRFIGAWQIATINDPESNAPNHEVPEYLALMAPAKSGLPFDFDQVRVFTWSKGHHRYETGFRLRPINGFLPVKIYTAQTPQGPVPAFSFQIASSDDVKTDPATGVIRPSNPRTIEYEIIDTTVKRIGADMAPIATKRAPDQAKKPAAKKKK
jgi:hypothetical protein